MKRNKKEKLSICTLYMMSGACLLGVEVSLETQNDLLDLAAQRLGSMSAEQALEPVEVKGNAVFTYSIKCCCVY